MRILRSAVARSLVSLLIASSAAAAETNFAFKASHRDVTADPDGIWAGDAFAGGKVSIFAYELRSTSGTLLVSQIWNEECSSSVCPTRLVRIEPGGRRSVLVDDMMHQIVPPNDPRFAGRPGTAQQVEFERHPFRLSDGGKKLLNGDFSFEIERSGR